MSMEEQHVIGEGVVLDTRPASFLTRGLAFTIDVLVLAVLFIIVANLPID